MARRVSLRSYTKSDDVSPTTGRREIKRLRRSRRRVLVPEYLTTSEKRVWLTIDDGPHPKHTDKILSELKTQQIKATFFVVGRNVEDYKAIVQKAFDAGHRIGNHSYSHQDLRKLSEAEVRKEIRDTHALIKDFVGSDLMFRPPFGLHNALVDKVASELGYRAVPVER